MGIVDIKPARYICKWACKQNHLGPTNGLANNLRIFVTHEKPITSICCIAKHVRNPSKISNKTVQIVSNHN